MGENDVRIIFAADSERDGRQNRCRRDDGSFTNALLVLLICYLLFPFSTAAAASDGTAAYLAARDHYIEDFATAQPSSEREMKALDDLERRLKEIIPPWEAPRVSVAGKISLSTLVQDMGFGQLDGLVYASHEPQTSVVVTTLRLVDRWIADHNRLEAQKADKIPLPLDAAMRSEPFWHGVSLFEDTAAFMFAEIPVQISGGSGVVLLAGSTQTGFSTDGPSYLLTVIFRGGRVFVAHQNLNARISQQPDCEHQLEADSTTLSKIDEQTADRHFRACFAPYLQRHPQYEAVQNRLRRSSTRSTEAQLFTGLGRAG